MAVAQLWDTLTQAIAAYTGLSPAVFFTVLAVAATIYYALSGLFAAPPPPARRSVSLESEPLLPPVQLGEITEEELKQYDGSDPKKPLLMAIKGQIYDVSQSRMFYGPGGPYALFAGKDASRALAKMSFEDKDLNGDISGLGPFELDALQDWEYKFMSKYVKVGTIKKSVHVEEGGASSDAANRDLSTEKDEPKEEVPTSATAGIIEPKEEVPTSATEGVVEPKEEVPEVATGVKERADEIPQQKDSSSADQPEAKKE